MTGNICPEGHFCPERSSNPTPCPVGTFLNSPGNAAVGDCLPCPPGEFCPGTGRILPAGNCSDGYYCPGGQNVSQPAEYRSVCFLLEQCFCWVNLSRGADLPVYSAAAQLATTAQLGRWRRCAVITALTKIRRRNGRARRAQLDITVTIRWTLLCWTIQPQFARLECTALKGLDISTSSSARLEHSTISQVWKLSCMFQVLPNTDGCIRDHLSSCVEQLFSGMEEEADCTPCAGGFYCPQPGMTTPVDLCSEGYYCRQYARSPAPNQGLFFQTEVSFELYSIRVSVRVSRVMLTNECFVTGTDANVCPEGHFCPLGTEDPEPCPVGTYNNGTGLEKIQDCVSCPAGEFCAAVGLEQTSGLCQEG